ncbi:hypothetical protein BDW74DRAFT_44906 [Aspergillus multicolor]|uniref:uncharacterized protein n=1 Tax=Aspergillus multicolor TaxID=41759 RepID=UPI003CCD193E
MSRFRVSFASTFASTYLSNSTSMMHSGPDIRRSQILPRGLGALAEQTARRLSTLHRLIRSPLPSDLGSDICVSRRHQPAIPGGYAVAGSCAHRICSVPSRWWQRDHTALPQSPNVRDPHAQRDGNKVKSV